MGFKKIEMPKMRCMTFQVLVAVGCALALSACTQAEKSHSDVNVQKYQCNFGESVQVTYYTNEERAVLERHGELIELKQKPSASGFIYSNGPNTIRGKGDRLVLEIGRMAPIECKAL